MNLLFQKLKHGKVSGQMVVMFVLFLAVLIVFLAAVMNLGKIAQLKTALSIAADSAAITMASNVASYSYRILREGLGGVPRQCGPSVWMVVIITIVGVLASVASFVGAFAYETLAAVLFQAIISGLSVPLQIYAAVQAAKDLASIQEDWQKKMVGLAEEQRFVESTIRTALMHTVSDPVEVEDIHDINLNRDYTDSVGRFLVLYNERLTRLISGTTSYSARRNAAIEQFRDQWEIFLCYLGWALPSGGTPPACSGHPSNVFKNFIGIEGQGFTNPSTGLYGLLHKARGPGDHITLGYNFGSIGNELWWCPGFRACIPVPYWFSCDNRPGHEENCIGTPPNNYCCFSPAYVNGEPSPTRNDGDCSGIAFGDSDFVDIFNWRVHGFIGFSDRILNGNLTENFANWFTSLYRDPNSQESWYRIMRTWQQQDLTHIITLLGNIQTWIAGLPGGISGHCQNDPYCIDDLTAVNNQIPGYITRANEIKNTIAAFSVQIDNLVQTINTVNLQPFNVVTYSWQDGLGWHHIKVTVENKCRKFPYVGKVDTNWSHDCFALLPVYNSVFGGGAVKVTIIRYDEKSDLVKLGSGKSLWRFIFTHPASGPYSADPPSTLQGCEVGDWEDDELSHSLLPAPYFNIGKAGINCSDAFINESLRHGVKSVSCAEFSHVGPKFVPCAGPNSYASGSCEYD